MSFVDQGIDEGFGGLVPLDILTDHFLVIAVVTERVKHLCECQTEIVSVMEKDEHGPTCMGTGILANYNYRCEPGIRHWTAIS